MSMDRMPRQPKPKPEDQGQVGERLRGQILDGIIAVCEEIDEILGHSPPRTDMATKVERLAPSLKPDLAAGLEDLVRQRALYDRAIVKLRAWMVPNPSLVKYSVVSKDDEPTVVVTRGELEDLVEKTHKVLATLQKARAAGITVAG